MYRLSRYSGSLLSPTMISALLNEPDVDQHAYDRLELMMYGAAPMTPALLRRSIDVFGCDFLNAFGAGTEAGLQTLLTPDDHRRALSGRPPTPLRCTRSRRPHSASVCASLPRSPPGTCGVTPCGGALHRPLPPD